MFLDVYSLCRVRWANRYLVANTLDLYILVLCEWTARRLRFGLFALHQHRLNGSYCWLLLLLLLLLMSQCVIVIFVNEESVDNNLLAREHTIGNFIVVEHFYRVAILYVFFDLFILHTNKCHNKSENSRIAFIHELNSWR